VGVDISFVLLNEDCFFEFQGTVLLHFIYLMD